MNLTTSYDLVKDQIQMNCASPLKEAALLLNDCVAEYIFNFCRNYDWTSQSMIKFLQETDFDENRRGYVTPLDVVFDAIEQRRPELTRLYRIFRLAPASLQREAVCVLAFYYSTAMH